MVISRDNLRPLEAEAEAHPPTRTLHSGPEVSKRFYYLANTTQTAASLDPPAPVETCLAHGGTAGLLI